MGHSDPQTTGRYTHATDRAKRAADEAVRVLRENVCHKSAHNARTAASAAAVMFVENGRDDWIPTSDLTHPNHAGCLNGTN